MNSAADIFIPYDWNTNVKSVKNTILKVRCLTKVKNNAIESISVSLACSLCLVETFCILQVL